MPAGDMDFKQVMDAVNALKLDPQGSNLRQDIQIRLRQHAMTDAPWLPDWLMAAGKSVIMNSPRIATLAQQINAVMSSYTTTVTCVPGNPKLQNQADRAEKRYALRREALFTPQVQQSKRWEQMVVAFGFYKLVCGDPALDDPWSVLSPDPESCYFLMGEGSRKDMRPSIIAREFTMTVSQTIGRFKSRREGKQAVYKDGTWDFVALTEDKAGEDNSAASVKDLFEPCLFYELDDGEWTYIVGCDRLKKGRNGREQAQDGKVLWKRRNLTGGSSYVLVPGYMTGSRELREKYLPHLWGPMNVQYQIDVINTLRATRSMNIKPQILMERTPELYKAAMAMGFARPAPDGYESLGADSIIELDGKPHFWVLPEDKDLAALEESKLKELEAYIATELSLTQSEILKDAAVRNIQLALGIRAQQQGMMLTFEAIGQREILNMWAHSITCEGGYGRDEWGLYAKTPMAFGHGSMKPGDYITTKKTDLDFEHHIEVGTASLSDQERQFLIQSAVERKVAKISTWPEVLDAAGYQNRQEQMENLIEEEGYEGASQFYQQWLEPTFRQRMAERKGILIPSAQMLDQGTMDAQSNLDPAPNNFPLPQTDSVEGETGTGATQ